MIYPMNALVQLCKKYGVLSMVDAAHAIGQVKTDVKFADPDFWVSVCSHLLPKLTGRTVTNGYMPTGHVQCYTFLNGINI